MRFAGQDTDGLAISKSHPAHLSGGMAATLRHSRTEKSELALNAVLPAPIKTVFNRGRAISDFGRFDTDKLLFVMRFRFAEINQ